LKKPLRGSDNAKIIFICDEKLIKREYFGFFYGALKLKVNSLKTSVTPCVFLSYLKKWTEKCGRHLVTFFIFLMHFVKLDYSRPAEFETGCLETLAPLKA